MNNKLPSIGILYLLGIGGFVGLMNFGSVYVSCECQRDKNNEKLLETLEKSMQSLEKGPIIKQRKD